MGVHEDILAWAGQRSPWLQDALRRLATAGALDSADLTALLAMVKGQHGVPGAEAPTPLPLGRDHLRATSASTPVRLHELQQLRNVNRIASDQTLRLGRCGITVNFGENGSGKTGYVRVLKGACRSRQPGNRRAACGSARILGDVFRPEGEPSALAEAIIVFSRDGEAEPVRYDWRDGERVPDDLGQVSIFDGSAVPLIVDEDRSLRFMPFSLDLFVELGGVCSHLGGELSKELVSVKGEIERLGINVPDGTAPHRFLLSLSHETTEEAVRAATAWTSADEKRLEVVTTALDEARRGPWLAATDQTLRQVIERCERLERLSGGAVDEVKRLAADVDRAEELRRTASKRFGDEPLPGVGGEAWQALYRAARRFATEAARPGQPFPHTHEGDRCVLCQQPLDAEARARFERFETLVRDEATRQVEEARARLERRIDELRSETSAPLPSCPWEALFSLATHDAAQRSAEELVTRLHEFHKSVSYHVDQLLNALPHRAWDSVTAAKVSPPKEPAQLLQRVLEIRTAIDRAVRDRPKLEGELRELGARRRLRDQADIVRQIVTQHQRAHRLELCRREVAGRSREITDEGRKLQDRYLGDALAAALEMELKALRLDSVRIQLETRGEKGITLQRVRLVEANHKAAVSEVLSDGEQRVLALACFLAESRTLVPGGTLVFDDPVSSLEHDRREDVARRFVALARDHQVIVFTHDLVFHRTIERMAAESGVAVEQRYLERRGEKAGLVFEALPFRHRSVDPQVNQLRHDVEHAKRMFDSNSPDYDEKVTTIVARFRQAWERAIEERVFNGAVVRFDHVVKPGRLESAAVPEVLKTMVRQAWARLSANEVHNEADAVVRPGRAPEDLRQEFEQLTRFLTEIERHAKGGDAPTPAEASAPPAGRKERADSSGKTPRRPARARRRTQRTHDAEVEAALKNACLVMLGTDGQPDVSIEGRDLRRLLTSLTGLDAIRRELQALEVRVDEYLSHQGDDGALPVARVFDDEEQTARFVSTDAELESITRTPSKQVVMLPSREECERLLRELTALGFDAMDLTPPRARPGELFASEKFLLSAGRVRRRVNGLYDLLRVLRDVGQEVLATARLE